MPLVSVSVRRKIDTISKRINLSCKNIGILAILLLHGFQNYGIYDRCELYFTIFLSNGYRDINFQRKKILRDSLKIELIVGMKNFPVQIQKTMQVNYIIPAICSFSGRKYFK